MFDLQALAFQADITRVFSMIMSRELSTMTFPSIGVPEQHHGVSHHRNDPQLIAKKARIDLYQSQLFAYFLEKLQSMTEGDGSVLDQSLLLYGGGMGDGNMHRHSDLPTLMAGGLGGKFKMGRHLQYKLDTPMANLLLTIMDGGGVPPAHEGRGERRPEPPPPPPAEGETDPEPPGNGGGGAHAPTHPQTPKRQERRGASTKTPRAERRPPRASGKKAAPHREKKHATQPPGGEGGGGRERLPARSAKQLDRRAPVAHRCGGSRLSSGHVRGPWSQRGGNDAHWGAAVDLGEKARGEIRGYELDHYLMSRLEHVRAKTLQNSAGATTSGSKSRPPWEWPAVNNYFKWFHVIGHEINHRGQIQWESCAE